LLIRLTLLGWFSITLHLRYHRQPPQRYTIRICW